MNSQMKASSCANFKGAEYCISGNSRENICGVWWLRGRFDALCLEGSRFESHCNRHVGTLDKSFTQLRTEDRA